MALVTNKKIGVLMGGLSSEREVSLASGNAILSALREKGYHPVAIDVGRDAAEKLRGHAVEMAFIALHGKFGEDGAMVALLQERPIGAARDPRDEHVEIGAQPYRDAAAGNASCRSAAARCLPTRS